MGWFKHVSDAVYDALCAAMELDPDLQTTMDRIRPAYVPGTTIPQHNSNEDVVFYALSEDVMAAGNYIATRTEAGSILVTKRIPISLLLTFYGPNADDDAELVWHRLMVDYGAGSPRSILRRKGLTFNAGPGKMPPRPVSAPELEGTLWRRRCDLRLSMWYLATDTVSMNPVEHVPEINIKVADNTAGKDD